MPTNTYVALDKATVTTATPSITFTGVSSAYTDLIIVASIKAESTTIATPALRFNGDTTSNYSATWLYGNGTTALSSRASTQTYLYTGDYVAGVESTNFSTFISHIMNYSNTTTFKTVLSRNSQINSADGETGATVGLWRKTPEAISTILYTSTNGANFAVGSTFSLYGIRAEGVSPAPKATGGAIYSDADYYYHAFGASGTFTPTQSITADVLVVAGGGGSSHGGGGAGGLLGFASQSLTATGYTVTVGGGGAGASSRAVKGVTGGDSQFGALTLVKGGGGAGSGNAGTQDGLTGGSGGGGGPVGASVGTAGSGTSGQGNAGGNSGTGAITYPGGGGGGAGAVGAVGVNATGGGAGGVGLSTYSSWGTATGIGQNVSGTYYLAGGGGGGSDAGAGAGGFGGGGAGSATASTAGTANTGGGAGGSSNNNGVAGGSGVVIVRYAK
jgi:hypothetical protein